ncbi:hypothetical protein [Alteromonas mediterranea]|uniref:hypothetical protein n=1 Tax=Alteromonas mediterranea TaxID=314275 RepID=UPI000A61F09C|nr:hypothetical protein [Alteromonas mediterranea]
MGDTSLSLEKEELKNLGLDVDDGNIFIVIGEPRSEIETLETRVDALHKAVEL